MKTIHHLLRFALTSLFLLVASSHAATPPSSPAGHWEGAIAIPNMKLEIRVDLASSADPGGWSGTIDIPAQGLRGFQLAGVVVEGSRVSFKMPGIPGDPIFDGTLAGDRKRLTGEFRQGPQKFPFSLEQGATLHANEPPASAHPVAGTGLVGHWQGSLSVSPAISMRMVLHVAADATGALTATLDSIDQNAKGLPVSSVTLTNEVARVEFARMGALYEGKLSANGAEIEGRWKQGPNDLPLVFRRLSSAPENSRPQEPKKPYPYQEHSVNFPGGASDVTLAGTLTVPSGKGPFPAVVLLGGSGPGDRDEASMGHRPFLVLADHLTRQGIAVLRFDDRGCARSTGDFALATHEDFAADARAAFNFLKAQVGIDPTRVGLCGHSEGGVHAAITAAGATDVSFIVLLASIGVPIDQITLRQREDFLRVAGIERLAHPDGRRLTAKTIEIVRQRGATEETRAEIRALLHQIGDHYPAAQRAALGFSDSAINMQVAIRTSPWFLKLLTYDPAATFGRVSCPVLALNGEKDILVACRENLDAIKASLTAGGNTAVTIRALPGLNHCFQHCTTGLPSEYGTIEETMSPEVLALVSDWIRQRS